MFQALSLLPSGYGPLAMLTFFAAVGYYIFLVVDARRPGSKAAKDNQLGLKVVIGSVFLFTFMMTLLGLNNTLHYLITFDNSDQIKDGLPALLVGGAATAGLYLKVIDQTNWERFPKIARLVVGTIALFGLLALIVGLQGFLASIFKGEGWTAIAGNLVNAMVFGVAGLGATFQFSRFSGVEVDTNLNLNQSVSVLSQPQVKKDPISARPGGGVVELSEEDTRAAEAALVEARTQAQPAVAPPAQPPAPSQQAHQQALYNQHQPPQQPPQPPAGQYQSPASQSDYSVPQGGGGHTSPGQGRHGGYLGAPRQRGPIDDDDNII